MIVALKITLKVTIVSDEKGRSFVDSLVRILDVCGTIPGKRLYRPGGYTPVPIEDFTRSTDFSWSL